MTKNALTFRRYEGGWSIDPQIGLKNSFAYSSHLDFRKQPSQLSVLPGTREDSNGTVVDLVQNMVMATSGVTYALGDQGYFYKRTTAGVWSSEAKLDDGAYGLSYRTDIDKIFAASSTTLSEYSPISGSPSIKVNKYGESASTDSGATLSGGTNTYTLATSISENSNHKQEFTSDIEPLSKIRVQVSDGGTGNWTLTLHDDQNNSLATSTVTNGNITDNKYLDFEFSSQVRIYVKPNARTYHFHLTSTVADGTVFCSTAGDFNTCDFTIYADRLVSTRNGMHPIKTFLQFECIGNGNYLAVWEPLSDTPSNLEFLRHKLVFPSNLEVCGLAVWREYLAIATEYKTTSGDAQEGYIFFWDGLSSTYNFFEKIPEGSPYSLHEHKGVLWYYAGGSWHAYSGGDQVKVRTMPNTDSEFSDTTDTTVLYPEMATVRRGIHLFGFPSTTTNTSINYGVYSYGSVNKDLPDSFGYSYTISTGTVNNTGGNLKLGMIKNFGDSLFISWKDGASTYGVDIIDNNSDPATTATWESQVFDDDQPFKEKTANYIDLTFSEPTNTSIYIKYKIDRASSWTLGNAVTSGTKARLNINKRFYEIQIGFDLTTTSTSAPVLHSETLVFDDNRNEAYS